MKKLILSIILIPLLLELNSCAISETQSEPKHYNIIMLNNRNDTVKLFIHKGAGKYEQILPVENIFSVDIEPMQGGYSNFLGLKFNNHIPEDYKVLKIEKKMKTIKEFSINEIEQFKKDVKGNYLMPL
ncbi:MAG: hypothetical protein PHE33_02765 [Bacteroidales bacterium]|nr:hypothetical protein [Bacteroidales bacterium]